MTRPIPVLRKREVDAVERRRAAVTLLGRLALAACALGVVIGIRLAVRTQEVLCDVGDRVGTCTRHARTEGVVIVLISIVLAVLVVLASIAARVLLEARARELQV